MLMELVLRMVLLVLMLVCVVDGFNDARDHVGKAETGDKRLERFVLVLEPARKTLKLSVGFEAHLIEATTSLLELFDTSLTTLAKLSLRLSVLESTLGDEGSIGLTGNRDKLLAGRDLAARCHHPGRAVD